MRSLMIRNDADCEECCLSGRLFLMLKFCDIDFERMGMPGGRKNEFRHADEQEDEKDDRIL